MNVEFQYGLLRALGTALILFAVGVVCLWALAHYPMFLGAGVIVFIVFFCGYVVVSVRRDRDRVKRVDAAFRDVYAQLSPAPVIEISGAYGFPALKISFGSKSAMDAAALQNAVFKTKIGEIYRGCGTRSNPFDADRAIFFTYDGYFDEIRTPFSRTAPDPRPVEKNKSTLSHGQ